jgi:stage II sporulation protein M
MYRAFRDRFVGQAKSVSEWYRTEIPLTLKQIRQPLMIVAALMLVSLVASYYWVVVNVPNYVALSPDRVSEFKSFVSTNLVNLDRLHEQFPAPLLFFNNARTTIVFLLLGLISFGTLGLAFFMFNMVLVGGVIGAAQLVGFSPLLTFAAGILPHGVFELTAVVLATAAMLKVCAQLVSPNTDKSLGEAVLLSLADWFRIFIGLVVPLLAVASVIEIFLTPALIKMVFPLL